jgi:hypothetical protein
LSGERIGIAIIIGLAAVILATVLILGFHRSPVAGGRFHGGQPGAQVVRTLNTAEITYATTYPEQGYAPDLATLGPGRPEATNTGCQGPTTAHACLIDARVGCNAGSTAWCVSGPYRYSIQSSSSKPPYRDYWITATPIEARPEHKNYCSASDLVVRSEQSLPLSRPYTLAECLALKAE